MASSDHGFIKFIKDNSMSIAFFSLFGLSLAAQSWSGWFSYDSARSKSGLSQIPFSHYLQTGTFWDGVFSNWQAAVLQLGVLIAFGSVLHQRGAAHSKKPDDEPGKKGDQKSEQDEQNSNTTWKKLYENSLSLAFILLFLVFFILHMIFGWIKSNEEEVLRRHFTTPFRNFIWSGDFWFSVFQTWEAEFFAIGTYMVLSIFLRQKGSSESKPTNDSNQATGETNE
jgi:preprotein translocase subunit SecG